MVELRANKRMNFMNVITHCNPYLHNNNVAISSLNGVRGAN